MSFSMLGKKMHLVCTLAVALVLAAAFSAFFSTNAYAVTSFECDGITYSVISEDDATVGLIKVSDADALTSLDEQGCWHIPGTAKSPLNSKEYTVVSACSGTFYESCCSVISDQVKTIEFPASLETLGNYAFVSCGALESLSIPNTIKNIEDNVFAACSSLTSVQWPESDLTTLPFGIFQTCSSLTDVQLPDTITVLDGSVFSQCSSLQEIQLPKKLTTIGSSAFAGCTSLEGVELPQSVETIKSSAFKNCVKLKTIVLPESLTDLFCGSSNWGDYTTGAFVGCTGLTSVSLPSALAMFSAGVFSQCTNLSEINVSSGNTAFKSEDGVVLSKNGAEIIAYPAGKSVEGGVYRVPKTVNSFSAGAFLGSVSLNELDCTEMSKGGVIGLAAFNGCSSLKSVKFASDARLSYIDSYAFKNCVSLTGICIPMLTAAKVNSKYFDGYGPLWHGSLGPVGTTVESHNAIGSGVFSGCTNLGHVVFKAGNASGAKCYMTCETTLFENCSSLDSVIFESDQCYFMDPNGSAQNYGTFHNIWTNTGSESSPNLYYSISYYTSKEQAEADAAVSTNEKTYSNRLARVEYKRGTPLQDIAVNKASSEGYAYENAAVYSDTDSDGIAPDPASAAGHEGESGWIWAFDHDSCASEGLTESTYAYPVKQTDITAARLSADELTSIKDQSPKHVESWLDPSLYTTATAYMLAHPSYKAVEGEIANKLYKYWSYDAAYNNSTDEVGTVTKWFELDSSGARIEDLSVSGGDGTLLTQGQDYSISWRAYDEDTYAAYPDPSDYAEHAEPCCISDKGAYLLVIEGEGSYTGSIAVWVLAKKNEGTVDAVYADTSDAAIYKLNMNTSKAVNTSKAYASVCDGSKLSTLCLASGFAGVADGWLLANDDDNATRNAIFAGTSGSLSAGENAALAFGLDNSISPTIKESYYPTNIYSSDASFANAVFSVLDPTEYKRSDAEVSDWGDTAVLCPVDLPDWCSAIAEYIYMKDAYCFFMENDGSVSDDTLKNLAGFKTVAIPGGESIVSEDTLNYLKESLPSGTEIVRVAEDATCAGEFSLEIARLLIDESLGKVASIAIVDGQDSNFISAGITQVAYNGGIVLQSASVADSKAIAAFIQQYRDSVKSVFIIGRDANGDGYADGMSNEEWVIEDQLKRIWDSSEEQDVITSAADGDTFAFHGCMFEIVDNANKKANFTARVCGDDSISIGDEICGYSVVSVSEGAYVAAVEPLEDMEYGTSGELNLSVPANSTVNYRSSDLGVVAVNDAGSLTTVGVGSALVNMRIVDTETGRFVASVATGANVTPRDISNASIDDISDQPYTGKACEPALVVRDGDAVLKAGVDYEATYADNVELGQASVTVAGKGNYTGRIGAMFNVSKSVVDMSGVKLASKTYAYDGKAKSLAVTGLPEGVSVKYTGNGKAGVGTYTVTAAFSCDANHTLSVETLTATLTINKASQTVTASKGTSKTVTYKKAKSGKLGATKTITAKALKAKFGLFAQGALAFKKANAKGGAKIKVSSAGKVTIKKGLKKGTYKVKVKVAAKATANYNASAAKYVYLTVKVK